MKFTIAWSIPLLVLAIFFTDNAFAGGVKGGGGTGFDEAKSTNDGLDSGTNLEPKIPRYGCREGNRSLFDLIDPISGRRSTVLRTCSDGTYMTPAERAAYIYNPQSRCKEGRRELWYERDRDDKSRMRHVICINGKWVTNKTNLGTR